VGEEVCATVTTEFNSFDQSPLGAFVESPLGARNKSLLSRLVIAMTWCDEAEEYQRYPPTYYIELSQWQQFVIDVMENEGVEVRATIVIPLGSLRGRWWDLIPPFVLWPEDDFKFAETGRPGSLLEFINAFNAIREGDIPTTLVLLVDESGSMDLGHIQPTYDAFKLWLRTNYPAITIREGIWADERWIRATQAFVRVAIDLLPP